MAFPTLSRPPDYPLVWSQENDIITTPFEAGYVQRRKRNTRARKSWQVRYSGLPSGDITTLLAYEAAQAALTFAWTNPENSTTYNVYFKGPVQYRLTDYLNYDASFELVEE